MRILMPLFTLLLMTSAISACNTVTGAGEDIKQGGQAIENAGSTR